MFEAKKNNVLASGACYTASRNHLSRFAPLDRQRTICDRQQWIFSKLHRLEILRLRRFSRTMGRCRCPPASDNSCDDSEHSFNNIEDTWKSEKCPYH